jgi:hypothetical protein
LHFYSRYQCYKVSFIAVPPSEGITPLRIVLPPPEEDEDDVDDDDEENGPSPKRLRYSGCNAIELLDSAFDTSTYEYPCGSTFSSSFMMKSGFHALFTEEVTPNILRDLAQLVTVQYEALDTRTNASSAFLFPHITKELVLQLRLTVRRFFLNVRSISTTNANSDLKRRLCQNEEVGVHVHHYISSYLISDDIFQSLYIQETTASSGKFFNAPYKDETLHKYGVIVMRLFLFLMRLVIPGASGQAYAPPLDYLTNLIPSSLSDDIHQFFEHLKTASERSELPESDEPDELLVTLDAAFNKICETVCLQRKTFQENCNSVILLVVIGLMHIDQQFEFGRPTTKEATFRDVSTASQDAAAFLQLVKGTAYRMIIQHRYVAERNQLSIWLLI